MFKTCKDNKPIYADSEELKSDLLTYGNWINRAIHAYVSFNETNALTKEEQPQLYRFLDEVIANLKISTNLIGVIGSGLNLTPEDLNQGLDHFGVQIGIKTPSLFNDEEDLVDKLYMYANIYRNKYFTKYIIEVDKYKVVFHNGIKINQNPTLNHNVFFLSSCLFSSLVELPNLFTSKDKAEKFRGYRELLIIHTCLTKELQTPKDSIGW